MGGNAFGVSDGYTSKVVVLLYGRPEIASVVVSNVEYFKTQLSMATFAINIYD